MARRDKRIDNVIVQYGENELFTAKDAKGIITAIQHCMDCLPPFTKKLSKENSHSIKPSKEIFYPEKSDNI